MITKLLQLSGRNGAGKTTLLEMLMTLRSFDSGNIFIMDYDLRKESHIYQVRSKFGVVFQEGGMYAYLRIREILDLFAGFSNVSKQRVEEVIRLFSLESHLGIKYEKLSGGWKQRTLLAISFLHKPQLLFLDEPTTGLDPQATEDLWEVIRLSKEKGTSVLLSTHSLEEIDMYCDRVMILNNQKIAEFDTPEALKDKYECSFFKEVYFKVLKGGKK